MGKTKKIVLFLGQFFLKDEKELYPYHL